MRGKKLLCAGLACLLLASLFAVCQAETYRTLKVGSEGKDVQRFKTAMYWLGYFKEKNVSDQYNSLTAERVKLLQRNNGLPETGEADPALQELVYSGNCVPGTMGPTPSPVPPPTAAPTPSPTPMPLPDRTEEGFLRDAEEGEEFVYVSEEDGVWLYYSASLSIEIRRYEDRDEPLVWYEADIRCSPESPLVSYVNGSKAPGTSLINPMTFARQRSIVLAISDDHFGHRVNEKGVDGSAGLIIREGSVLRTDVSKRAGLCTLDVLAVFEDGSMKTFARGEHKAQEYLDMGVKSTYSFGPILIQNGELTEQMLRDDYYPYHEPRMALGMIAPYHYYALCVEGRIEGRSRGAYLPWLAQNMLEKGVTEAMNLDGGGTAIMVFMGDRVNKSGVSTRSVGSMTGFGVSPQVTGK